LISINLKERKSWGENHKALNEIILKAREHAQAIQLFLSLHAWLYSSEVGNIGSN
jgi:hypothetical protein